MPEAGHTNDCQQENETASGGKVLTYRVRNSRGQIAAEVSESGLSIHDQKLSWELKRLRDRGDFPFSKAAVANEPREALEDLVHFLEDNGFTVERDR